MRKLPSSELGELSLYTQPFRVFHLQPEKFSGSGKRTSPCLELELWLIVATLDVKDCKDLRAHPNKFRLDSQAPEYADAGLRILFIIAKSIWR